MVRSSPMKVMHSKDDLLIAKSTKVLGDHDAHFGLKILQAKRRVSWRIPHKSARCIYNTTSGENWIGEIRGGEVRYGFLKSPPGDLFWRGMHPWEEIIASLSKVALYSSVDIYLPISATFKEISLGPWPLFACCWVTQDGLLIPE